jgi:hypothetical protein
MFLKAMDYAFFERGAIGVIGIGDHIQGRNYRGMPIENWVLGSMTLEGMQQMLFRLVRPYFTLPQVEFWTASEGNHERNTDREELGINFLTPLKAAIEQHIFDTGHEIITQFPVYSQLNTGTVVRAPYGYLNVNNLGILYSHMYSQKGAGKGSSARPSSHLSSAKRNMGSLTNPYALFLGAHFHVVDVEQADNTFCAILGSTAVESGYEVERQYGGSQPIVGLLHFQSDGHFDVELLNQRYFQGYQIQHPGILAKGVDAFIQSAINQDIYPLHSGQMDPQRFYRRDLVMNPPIVIK